MFKGFPAGSIHLRTLGIYPDGRYTLWDVLRLPDGRQVTLAERTLVGREGPAWTGRPPAERVN